MTDTEILSKAIDKAIANGFDRSSFGNNPNLQVVYGHIIRVKIYYADIFSHSFAKAFWGEEFIDEISVPGDESMDSGLLNAYYDSNLRVWQYHLQQMVLEENPIKYLEKFL